MEEKLDQLKDLATLKDQGVLTEEEFAAQKARILGS
ncbi:SHOCT domain-containing protein [Streptomyces sp. XY431]